MSLKPDFKIDDLQALAVFAAVVRQGSMSGAARAWQKSRKNCTPRF